MSIYGIASALLEIKTHLKGLETAVAEGDVPSLLRDCPELVSLGVQARQLGEHDVLALAIDGERPVASLADPDIDRARGDAALRGEQLALRGDHAPARG